MIDKTVNFLWFFLVKKMAGLLIKYFLILLVITVPAVLTFQLDVLAKPYASAILITLFMFVVCKISPYVLGHKPIKKQPTIIEALAYLSRWSGVFYLMWALLLGVAKINNDLGNPEQYLRAFFVGIVLIVITTILELLVYLIRHSSKNLGDNNQ